MFYANKYCILITHLDLSLLLYIFTTIFYIHHTHLTYNIEQKKLETGGFGFEYTSH